MAMKKPAKKTSRFAGVRASGDRLPLLPIGDYRLEITSNKVGSDTGADYFKLGATVTEVRKCPDGSVSPGDETLAALICISGRAAKPGLSRVKALAIALAGCANEAELDEMDPDGLFCEHVLGEGDGSDNDGNEFPEIVGMQVDCVVRKGNERDDGDYYREHSWSAVGAE